MSSEEESSRSAYKWSVYKAKDRPALRVGDHVYSIKKKSRAVVTKEVDENVDSPYSRRVEIRYFADGSLYHAQPSKLLHIASRGVRRVIVTRDTVGFRHLARSMPTKDDFCVELGSSYGVCTDLMSKSAGRAIGVEISAELVEESRKRYPHVQFECIDALVEKRRIVELAKDATLLYVDIGGDRLGDTLVLLIPLLLSLISPEVMVIKCEELADAAENFTNEAGEIQDFSTWWTMMQKRAAERSEHGGSKFNTVLTGTGAAALVHRHPLTYPFVRAKVAEGGEDTGGEPTQGREICRYYNYLECKKGDMCTYDHTSCHSCREIGHRAIECTTFAGISSVDT